MDEEEENNYEIKQPHVSILQNGEMPRLTGCTDWSCGCHKHHCPMCTLAHFKPSNKTQTLKHLKWHFKHGYRYKNVLICGCKLGCLESEEVDKHGHFHCPECGQIAASKSLIITHIAVEHEGKAPPMKDKKRSLDTQTGSTLKKRRYLMKDEEFTPRKSSRFRKTIDYNALAEDGVRKAKREDEEEEEDEEDKQEEKSLEAMLNTQVPCREEEQESSQTSMQVPLEEIAVLPSGGEMYQEVATGADDGGDLEDETSEVLVAEQPNSQISEDDIPKESQLDVAGLQRGTLSHINFPHRSIIRSVSELSVSCEDDACTVLPSGESGRCAFFHCAVCPKSHFKPVKYKAPLMKHLQWHMRFAFKYRDVYLTVCKQQCTFHRTEAHYHCPHCDQKVVKKANLISHLIVHNDLPPVTPDLRATSDLPTTSKITVLPKVESEEVVRLSVEKSASADDDDDDNEGDLIQGQGDIIQGQSDLGQDQDAQLPDTDQAGDSAPPTLDAGQMSEELQAYAGKRSVEIVSKEIRGDFLTGHDAIAYPHVSLVTGVEDMLKECHRCNKRNCPNCSGKLFHCPVCPAKVKLWSAMVSHVETHVETAVTFRGIKICLCKLRSCLPKLKSKSLAHYHCPLCGSIQAKGVRLRAHLKAHKLGTVRTRDSVAGEPRRTRKHNETSIQQRETLDSFPAQHPSTIASAYDILGDRCKRPKCRCRGFHCPLCPVKYFKPPLSASHLLNHGENHINHSVPYKGVYLTLCRLKCKAGSTTSHYHCPECSHISRRRHLMVEHMRTHDPTFTYKPVVPASSEEKTDANTSKQTAEAGDVPLTEADIFVSVTAIISNKLFAAIEMDQKEVLQALSAETGILCAMMEDGQNVIQGSWEALNKATEKLKAMAGLTAKDKTPAEDTAKEPDVDSGGESDLNDLDGQEDDPDYDPIYDCSKKSKRRYLCGLCSYETGELSDMHNHVRFQHENAYKCLFCGRVGTSEYDLKRHLQTIHQDHPMFDVAKSMEDPANNLQCPKCQFRTHTDKILFYHTLLNHYEKGKTVTRHYQCTQCKYSSNNIGNLRAHIGRKHPTEKHLCNQCGKEFGFDTDLKEHISVVHDKSNCCVCDLCGKEFASRRYLQAHLKRHLGIKNHECPICGKRFMEKVRMREHMDVHQDPSTRVLKHECDICHKRFANGFYMKDHMNTHTGEKPHVCPHCGQSYALRLSLRNHLLTHQKDKPFACEVCPKAFKTKMKLNYHMITHTGISDHECTKCRKVFTQRSTLRRHRCPGFPKKRVFKRTSDQDVDGSDMQVQVHSLEGGMTIGKHEVIAIGQNDQQLLIMDGAEEGSEVKEQELYMCSICNNIFMNWNEMESHMQEHISEGQGQGQGEGQQGQGQGQPQGQVVVGETVGSSMSGNSTDVVSAESIEMAIALAELPSSM